MRNVVIIRGLYFCILILYDYEEKLRSAQIYKRLAHHDTIADFNYKRQCEISVFWLVTNIHIFIERSSKTPRINKDKRLINFHN